MTKIISNPNCGNSPKMEFLKDFNIAFATGNVEFTLESDKKYAFSDFYIFNGAKGSKIKSITSYIIEI